MASDSQVTYCDFGKLRGAKLFRLKDGGVAAGCGPVSEIVAAVKWLQKGGKPPKMKTCDVLVARPDGTTAMLYPGGIYHELTGPAAIGSGAQAALAAMLYFGSSAEEAVMAAAEVDPGTSAPVAVMRVEPKAKRRRKS